MTDPSQIVVLAAPGRTTNALVNRLAVHFAVHLVLEEPEGRWLRVRRRAKRIGWWNVLGQLAFVATVAPLLERASASRIAEIAREHELCFSAPRVRTIRIRSVNDAETPALVAALKPSAVVLSGTRIVKGEVLTALGAVTLNIHAGITPTYRGLHGGYWALVREDPERCGVTVHMVDPGVDTGPVIGQTRVKLTERDGYATLPFLQLATALPTLIEALTRIVLGKALEPLPAGGESRQWYHPTICEYLRHRLGRGLR